jgi:hypothetical protein
MSLDGFIAGPGGDMSWMVDYLGPNPVVDQLIKRTGALLVGNRTFGGDDPHKGKPGEGKAFGDGTRLFERPGGKTVRLKQIGSTRAGRITNLWYRIEPLGSVSKPA